MPGFPRVVKSQHMLWTPLMSEVPRSSFANQRGQSEDELPSDITDMGSGGRNPRKADEEDALMKCTYQSLAGKMPPLEGAIVAQEETVGVIRKYYLKALDKEINSEKARPTLATVTRHFRLKKLTTMMDDSIEMEKMMKDWINGIRNELPPQVGKRMDKSIKKLEEVSDLQNRKWVSNKVALDVQYALKHVKYMETKISQFHDTVAESLSAILDLLNVFEQLDESTNSRLSQMPCTPLMVKRKLLELPDKYVAHKQSAGV
ncbi:uncharacterized protein LOC141899432 [Tubulanus polymorphus]|uniref:uncharacterized protein LOC141899432 n=1 Tax=Tubulanus polymorphus TaxID=672921 RepID=UPI003DA4CC75